MSKPKSIAIIGAGIGGLTAAAAMLKLGMEVTVYEQAPQFARVGAGIQMSPNAMKSLRGIGLEDRLVETGLQPLTSLNVAHDTGEVTNELPLRAEMFDRYGAPFLCLHRADLHDAIAANRDIGLQRLAAATIDQGAAPDYKIIFCHDLAVSRSDDERRWSRRW